MTARDSSTEPRQPRRLEKKRNTGTTVPSRSPNHRSPPTVNQVSIPRGSPVPGCQATTSSNSSLAKSTKGRPGTEAKALSVEIMAPAWRAMAVAANTA